MNPLFEILIGILKIFAEIFRDEIQKPKTAEDSRAIDPELIRNLRRRVLLAENRVNQTRGSDKDRPQD
jgi:hypothetical protein